MLEHVIVDALLHILNRTGVSSDATGAVNQFSAEVPISSLSEVQDDHPLPQKCRLEFLTLGNYS
jgi:hypothetical protein